MIDFDIIQITAVINIILAALWKAREALNDHIIELMNTRIAALEMRFMQEYATKQELERLERKLS